MRVLVLLQFLASFLSADSIAGRVTDPQGGRVAGARVSVFAAGSSVPRLVETDGAGAYRVAGVAAGSYLLQVERGGLRPFTGQVAVAGDVAQDVTLTVAGVANSVVVTAEAAALTLDQTAKAVSVIEGEELRARNEFSLVETLRNTPGMQIRNQGGPGQFSQIRVRGLRTDATQVLIDGLRFRDAATLQGDATSFAPMLNLVNLSRVEVLRGSGSSLYGTGAVGGSINMVTEQGGGATHGDAQLEGGGLGLWRGRATMGGGLRENRFIYSGGVTHLNVTRGVDDDDRARSTGGQGFVRFDLTPRLRVWNRYYGSDDFAQTNISPATTGIPARNFPANGLVPARVLGRDQVAVLNGGGQPNYGNATIVPGRNDPDAHRYSFFTSNALVMRHDVSAWTSWQASYQRLRTERVIENGAGGVGFQPPLGYSDLTNPVGTIDTVDGRWSGRPAEWLRLVGGYEFERERYESFALNLRPGNATVRAQTNVVQQSNAGYGQGQLSFLANRLQISVSGRVQGFVLDRPAFVVTGAANSYATAAFPAPPRGLTGDASVTYFMAKTGTKLRAHAGNAYRAPSLYERFGVGFFANAATGLVSFTAYGDPSLRPDRYRSFDWGIDQYFWSERVRLSATHFYTRIQNMSQFDFSGAIQARTDPYGRSSGYLNGAGGLSRGFELGVESRPNRALTLSGSYTYVNSDTDRDISVPGIFRALNVPAHQWSMVATQRIGQRTDVTFDVFHSGSYLNPHFAGVSTRAYLYPGFTRSDLVGGYRLWAAEGRTIRLYGKVENVFQREYYEQGVLSPTVWGSMGLTYSY